MNKLKETIRMIEELDQETMQKARERVDNLIKPPKSLGRLEDLAVQLAGITKTIHPTVANKAIIVMAADHGVYEEGIAGFPQEITVVQTLNFVKGVTGVCALGKVSGTKIIPVDIGVKEDLDPNAGVLIRKIKYGTDNMAKGPAMSREEAIRALEVGIEVANEEIKNGVTLLGTGEMGIGNTTASTAILSVLGNFDPKEITGRGAGLSPEGIQRKAAVIKRAIEVNQPDATDGIDVVAKVGGLEIAGMAGVMLAAAANRIPVVVDGYIATAAALIAVSLEPKTKQYLIPSHASAEIGSIKATELLGIKPMIHMDLCLGEGSGAALVFPIVEAACHMINCMPTFEEAGITI
ncbi:Nicotinate-nucleotide--dimethylbenzimidazole phosphoribosyltransferase [Alkaliphilus metalliredigens QYMF]|uniref:Nicotinate-nucleotide--dimethylbenzimidazole phosphoribosyltransferase n=1 Tax=Alkaliphilus metalliredigens (strain QYMF) TaxID=293826 RepID=COBT_ALKMQ|nr:nicotinate-nucleotide--dimethylbenzimidazole phosphoribosyltransferase [Alkaliphilus metalliredigens]A6TKH4.1 RecName: Full=Nicotinate-nucleotide--dimethylbenzimidazole phosphoribosyltransferase; Short=NN:DBI PRT; AltName: Full=N(1)-alpha-phosphoribosyltransferase [Alkaliphilus metalliredigens QYMF]ABR46692.1 Nicotinate-nucleotide--dimethylbenzimidazole phosphoribosyltransferase [Alkaliphilus metalliredigens QYMF]